MLTSQSQYSRAVYNYSADPEILRDKEQLAKQNKKN